MKTLILSGTVKKSEITPNMLTYDLCLFGQSKESPLCQVITYKAIEAKCYSEMQEIARKIYANYFNTDLFNIISIEHIRMV